MSTDRFPDFLNQPVDTAARQLLGCVLLRRIDDTVIRVRIVETESYDQNDEASHAFGGPGRKNATMFTAAGHLYVYFTYGMHHCCNIVTGPAGYGAGVLIRAVEPIENDSSARALLQRNRGDKTGTTLTNGPGKLTQALCITRELDGHDLHSPPLQLIAKGLMPHETISTSPRIGISCAKDVHRRYFIADNPYVSK